MIMLKSCACGCGREFEGVARQRFASDACRKRDRRRQRASGHASGHASGQTDTSARPNGHEPEEPDEPDEPWIGGLESAVTALIAATNYAASDPRAAIGAVALRLARAIDGGADRPGLYRELRVALSQMANAPNDMPTFVDEIQARRLARRGQLLLDEVERGRS